MTKHELQKQKEKLEEMIRVCEIEKVAEKIIEVQRKRLAEIQEKLNEIV